MQLLLPCALKTLFLCFPERTLGFHPMLEISSNLLKAGERLNPWLKPSQIHTMSFDKHFLFSFISLAPTLQFFLSVPLTSATTSSPTYWHTGEIVFFTKHFSVDYICYDYLMRIKNSQPDVRFRRKEIFHSIHHQYVIVGSTLEE